MNKHIKLCTALLGLPLLVLTQTVVAAIPGIGRVTGDSSCSGASCNFNLTARAGHIVLGDGNTLLTWGYSDGAQLQYPGPTLIVNQGDTVTVRLSNTLTEPVSIVFPGQEGVQVVAGTGDQDGVLTREVAAAPGGTSVSYTFTAAHAGTYLYQSGTRAELQVEMGLVGALIVRPTGYAEGDDTAHPNRRSYATNSTAYDREYLFFLTDMDRQAHETVAQVQQAIAAGNTPDPSLVVDPASFKATLWFINGRNGPDTMLKANVGWLPMQPYNALARMHPGERVLMRVVGAGRDLHPFHHHGNNAWLLARDGRVLESSNNAAANYPDFAGIPELQNTATVPDQSISNYTIQIVPGGTYDALFTWTGKGLNWDIYGHGGATCNAGTRLAYEDPESHCKAFPVNLPEQQSLTFGGLWSGSPYLQQLSALPPLQGGLNPGGGFSFMWHSHTERELTNDDIFPGGMMTMMIIEGPDVPIDSSGNID